MPLPAAQSAVPGGTSHRQMAVRYLSAHDALRKLRDNMREEHILVLDFVSTIFKHVSTRCARCAAGLSAGRAAAALSVPVAPVWAAAAHGYS